MQHSGMETSMQNPGEIPAQPITLEMLCRFAVAMFQHTNEKIALYNLKAETRYINPALKAILPDHLGGTADVVLHPFFWSYRETLEEVIRTGRPGGCVAHFTVGSQEIFDLISFSPLSDEHGQMIGVIAIGRQTDQRDAAETLEIRRREQYQRAVLNTFPFMVWLKDKQSRFLATNKAFAEVLQIAHDEDMRGKTDFDYFPHAMAEGYVADDQEVLASGAARLPAPSHWSRGRAG